MVSEIVEEKAISTPMYPGVAVRTIPQTEVCTIIQYVPEQYDVKEKLEKGINFLEKHFAELFVGTAALACLSVFTGGAAIPVFIVSCLAVLMW